ncbi:MAG: hypothetical protein A2284_04970 [Deltaproteobacteria bacterium RIFOXYA12_FULL_61_11]|nr:MAG: hypothetical protein A2284_04970 [Deltaproteobacteria bacterium RIFOXYA12_FULL_61_11]
MVAVTVETSGLPPFTALQILAMTAAAAFCRGRETLGVPNRAEFLIMRRLFREAILHAIFPDSLMTGIAGRFAVNPPFEIAPMAFDTGQHRNGEPTLVTDISAHEIVIDRRIHGHILYTRIL